MARPTDIELTAAAEALARGELVVFPTETVYGLGANALEPAAVARIFAAKGRPADNPLIVHVADEAAARKLVRAWPPFASKLAEVFWPGPLTLVLPRDASVPDITTGGLESVAVRVPAHPIAKALLERARVAVAAPSANRSGSPSPTRVEHARDDLGASVAAYLDGGPTDVGLESTVVSLLGERPVLLRPGGVTREQLEAVVGPIDVATSAPDAPVLSPGMKYRHYAPRAKVHLVASDALQPTIDRLRADGRRVGAIVSTESGLAGAEVVVPGSKQDAARWAHVLFTSLRELDTAGCDAIVVEEIASEGLGAAVLNRLRKAAEPQ